MFTDAVYHGGWGEDVSKSTAQDVSNDFIQSQSKTHAYPDSSASMWQ